MHNAPLSFLIYLLYFKNSKLLNCCELDPCVYDVFDSESALELNPEVVTFTPRTPCIFTTGDTITVFPMSKQPSLNEDVWGNGFTSPRINLGTIPVLVASITH